MRQSGAETLVTEEPYALIAHVRICGGAGWATTGSTRPPITLAFLSACASFVVIVGTYAWQRFPTAPTAAGILYALMSGVCGAIGMLFFSLAIKRGEAAIIVTLSAIYPIFIVLLGPLILQEKLSLSHAIGVLLVTLGVILVAR
jgi:bacterial/archaeal transporter family protein